MIYRNFSFLVVAILFFQCQEETASTVNFYFEEKTSESTGIEFRNDLTSSEELNTYTYRNFYNGAGVAIGDVNNDGLPDLLFCGNQVDNRLYLNKGSFEFEDITLSAGVASKNVWSTGANLVDVNGDGLLDIYVCKSGPPGGPNRKNELFINNGDLTFQESAEQYGIDDTGLSNHAAFFDYDKDGDLDMYLLNNSLRTIGVYDLKEGQREERDPYGGNKFYRNDEGKFIDISEEAGIYGSAIGFGLGVTIADINKDGWQDIFVSNDFFERDYCYVNNQDGTFTELLAEMMPEISMGSMGADIGDLNNDGLPEIYVTEMLPEKWSRLKLKTVFEKWDKHRANVQAGYHYQYTRNALQLNRGSDPNSDLPLFSEVSRLFDVHATDWSWGAIMADFDNDGFKDIFVANGIAKDLTDHDYVSFYANNNMYMAKFRKDSSVMTNLVNVMPSTPVPNYYFKNHKGQSFENISSEVKLDFKGFSNGSAYGDLDNDGDLDLVVNNINDEPKIYENKLTGSNYLKINLVGTKKNTSAVGAQISCYKNGNQYYFEHNPVKGYMSSMDHTLVIGMGNLAEFDSIVIKWPDLTLEVLENVKANQTLTIKNVSKQIDEVYSKSRIAALFEKVDVGDAIRHNESNFIDFNRDRLLFHMRSNEGPHVTVSKNGEFLFLPKGKGHESQLFSLNRSLKFTEIELPGDHRESEDVNALFFDADNDGDEDLYVCAGGNEHGAFSVHLMDRLYLNKGTEWVISELATARTSSSVAVSLDYDKDGDLDLVVGSRLKAFAYGLPADMTLLENDGTGKFSIIDDERTFAFKEAGLITDIEVADLNGDDYPDLVVGGEWMPVKVFLNKQGLFYDATADYGFDKDRLLANSIEVRDINNDNIPDILIGNHGLNSRLSASEEKPLTLYINDFDQNGSLDHILGVYEDNKLVPIVMLDDLLKQLPYLKKKYVKFADYKDASIEDIFGQDALKKSHKLEVTELANFSYLSMNEGYRKQILPLVSQIGPIYDFLIDDFNNDGDLDVIFAGNQTMVKPELGAYRSSYGQVLKVNKGAFEPLTMQESGIAVRGDVRSINKWSDGDNYYLIFGINDKAIEVYASKNR